MRGARDRGFTLTELLVVLLLFGLLAYILLPALARRNRPAHKIKCVNNLKNIGLAFRIYATDNSDRFPGSFFLSNRTDFTSIQAVEVYSVLSNELSTPKILYCSKDTEREPANSLTNFASVKSVNISYFASLNASEDNPSAFLAGDRNLQVSGRQLVGVYSLTTNSPISWSKRIHEEQGNLAMADGSVQQIGNNRLTNSLKDQQIATNLLAFP